MMGVGLLVKRIFDLLESKGVTSAELSKATGIATTPISMWKNGKSKPSPDAIVKVATYLCVSTDYLLGRSNERTLVNEFNQTPAYQGPVNTPLNVEDMTKRIVELVDSSGMTVRTFAQQLELSSGLLSKWRNGRNNISIGTVIKIADYFDVSTDYLLGRTNVNEPVYVQGKKNNDHHLRMVENLEEEYIMSGKRFICKDMACEALMVCLKGFAEIKQNSLGNEILSFRSDEAKGELNKLEEQLELREGRIWGFILLAQGVNKNDDSLYPTKSEFAKLMAVTGKTHIDVCKNFLTNLEFEENTELATTDEIQELKAGLADIATQLEILIENEKNIERTEFIEKLRTLQSLTRKHAA